MRGINRDENPNGLLIGILFLVLAAICASTAPAAECPVPTLAHPSIQAAVDDAACTEIVLGGGDFAESVDVLRSLVLGGDSSATTTIMGQVTIIGASAEVTLQDLKVDGGGCFSVGLDVTGGAQITSGQDVVVVNAAGGECPIFTDGFELGAAVAWSTTVP